MKKLLLIGLMLMAGTAWCGSKTFCDRCKINCDDPNELRVIEKDVIYIGQIGTHIDLCDTCKKQFDDWMKSKNEPCLLYGNTKDQIPLKR